MSTDWSSLPQEIWRLIIQKLRLEDYIRCRSVCSSWLSIARDLQQCSSQPRFPWLLLPPENGDHEYAPWRFYDIASDKVHRIHLPELRQGIIIGTGEGWLIVADERTADLRLFNPFTRAQIQLPPTTTFPDIVGVDRDSQRLVRQYHVSVRLELQKWKPWNVSRSYFKSAILTASDGGFTVVVIHSSGCDMFHADMSFTRAGDKAWTALEIPGQFRFCCKCTFFKGLFYLMDKQGMVLSFDLGSNMQPPTPLQVAPPCRRLTTETKYLVILPESGKLLLVLWPEQCKKRKIEAFSLDSEEAKWVEVKSLGGHSLFGLMNYSLSSNMMCLPAKDVPEMQGDCMYFIENNAVKVIGMEVQGIQTYPIGKISGKVGWDLRHHIWFSPVPVSLTGANLHQSRPNI